MTKTENYQLPQWEASDLIRRADFNAALDTIDGGLAQAFRPENMPYAVGTYKGTGSSTGYSQKVELGFRPSAVLVFGEKSTDSEYGWQYRGLAIDGEGGAPIDFLDTGFEAEGSSVPPRLNDTDRTFRYIAFR